MEGNGLEDIKKNIRSRGCIEPIRVRERPLGKEAWDGRNRLRASRELELEKVPIINEGNLSDKDIKARRTSLAIQRNENINYEELYKEWYRLYDEEEMLYDEISKLYGLRKSEIYDGISTYLDNNGNGKSEKKSSNEQSTLNNWKTMNDNNGDDGSSPSSSSLNKNSTNHGFEQTEKDINTQLDNSINREPEEINVMLSGKIHELLAKDIEGKNRTIPSRIIDILNLYYDI